MLKNRFIAAAILLGLLTPWMTAQPSVQRQLFVITATTILAR